MRERPEAQLVLSKLQREQLVALTMQHKTNRALLRMCWRSRLRYWTASC